MISAERFYQGAVERFRVFVNPTSLPLDKAFNCSDRLALRTGGRLRVAGVFAVVIER